MQNKFIQWMCFYSDITIIFIRHICLLPCLNLTLNLLVVLAVFSFIDEIFSDTPLNSGRFLTN